MLKIVQKLFLIFVFTEEVFPFAFFFFFSVCDHHKLLLYQIYHKVLIDPNLSVFLYTTLWVLIQSSNSFMPLPVGPIPMHPHPVMPPSAKGDVVPYPLA